MPGVSYDKVISEMYAEDPAAALETLRNTLEEGEAAELVIVQRQLQQAFGSEVELSEASGAELIREYRNGMERGELPLFLLIRVMKRLGLRLSVSPEVGDTMLAERETAA
jgi:DNA-binding phage protein